MNLSLKKFKQPLTPNLDVVHHLTTNNQGYGIIERFSTDGYPIGFPISIWWNDQNIVTAYDCHNLPHGTAVFIESCGYTIEA